MNKLIRKWGLGSGYEAVELYDRYLLDTSAILDIDGMPLHYRVTGSGPALVLIHGLGSCLHTWNKYHEYLSNDFKVISLDLPGLGLTGPPPSGDYSIEMYMQVFDRLLEEVGESKAHFAGNSLGGYMSWNYAARRPERVNKVVLMNAAGYGTDEREISDFGFKMAINPLTRDLTHKLTPRNLVRMSLENCVTDPSLVTEEKVELYHDHILRKGNRESFSVILKTHIVNGMDNTDVIKQVQAPTLILWGDEDALLNVEHAFRFQRAISDARMIIYPEKGHLPMLELPKRSAEDIRAFLLEAKAKQTAKKKKKKKKSKKAKTDKKA